jgi:hypothetical protein
MRTVVIQPRAAYILYYVLCLILYSVRSLAALGMTMVELARDDNSSWLGMTMVKLRSG